MQRAKLWAGLAAAVTVAAGVAVWSIQAPPDKPTESKPASGATSGRSAESLLQSALQRQVRQDTHGAARDYQRVLELDPRNKQAWYGLGVIDQQEGRTARARLSFEKALQIDPKFMSALYSEAYLLKSSDPDRAIELLKRAVSIEPKSAPIYLQLGSLLAEKNRAAEAEDAYRHAVTVDHRLLPQVPAEFRDSVSDAAGE